MATMRHLPYPRPLVAGEVVHDYDIAGLEFGHKHLLDIGFGGDAVDWSIEYEWRGNSGGSQAGDEGGRLPMAMRYADPQPLTTATAPVAPCHVRRGPGSVNEETLTSQKRRALLTA